jgi:hypothetical protein
LRWDTWFLWNLLLVVRSHLVLFIYHLKYFKYLSRWSAMLSCFRPCKKRRKFEKYRVSHVQVIQKEKVTSLLFILWL